MSGKELHDILRSRGPDLRRRFSETKQPCPEGALLRRYFEGALPPEEAAQISHHALGCPQCARTVLLWQSIEEADEKALTEEAQLQQQRPQEAAPVRHLRQRLSRRVLLPALALAAAVLAAVFLLPPSGPSELSARLVSPTGPLRSALLGRDHAICLQVSLAKPAYVTVVVIYQEGTEVLFPTEEDKGRAESTKPLRGTVRIPKEEAWPLQNLPGGRYVLVVGASARMLSGKQKKALCAALSTCQDSLSEKEIRNAAALYFDALTLLPFTILP